MSGLLFSCALWYVIAQKKTQLDRGRQPVDQQLHDRAMEALRVAQVALSEVAHVNEQ